MAPAKREMLRIAVADIVGKDVQTLTILPILLGLLVF
jgi:hypothetical protein